MRSSVLVLVVLAATVNSAFVYNEALATEEAALSFAAYCPDTAINTWKVGYVTTNYPNIEKPLVFENNIAVRYKVLYIFRVQKDILHTIPPQLFSEVLATFKIGWTTFNLIR